LKLKKKDESAKCQVLALLLQAALWITLDVVSQTSQIGIPFFRLNFSLQKGEKTSKQSQPVP
jgi:hypothetical protein